MPYRRRAEHDGGEYYIPIMEIGIQTCNCRIGLEFIPKGHNYNKSHKSADRCETKPHKPETKNKAKIN